MADYSQIILSRTLPFIGQHDNCELFRRQIAPKDLTEFLAWAPFTLTYGAVPQAGPQKFGLCWKKGFIGGIRGHFWGFEKLVIPQIVRVSDKSIISSKRPEISMNRGISLRGRSQTTFTRFVFFWPPTPSSCKRSLWTAPYVAVVSFFFSLGMKNKL